MNRRDLVGYRWPWGNWGNPQQETPPQPEAIEPERDRSEQRRPDTEKPAHSDTRTPETRADAHDLALTLQCAYLFSFCTTAGPLPSPSDD